MIRADSAGELLWCIVCGWLEFDLKERIRPDLLRAWFHRKCFRFLRLRFLLHRHGSDWREQPIPYPAFPWKKKKSRAPPALKLHLVRRPRQAPQLNRWSCARALLSGHRLDWSALRNKTTSSSPPSPASLSSSSMLDEKSPSISSEEHDRENDEEEPPTPRPGDGKAIYMVSDGTGSTAENSVNAALGQFEHCLVDRGCPVSTHLFSGVNNMDRLIEIIKQAAKEGAILLYTLADPSMADMPSRHARFGCAIYRYSTANYRGHSQPYWCSPIRIPRGAPGGNR
ncbi:hypothetical protein HPP92_009885 [Vanilla planifolia]|uniref:Uncharacterized protein n=1 Tax=Vanilla planifolia TaxID=51239 RepID=A0A835R310_VANPL|nr:hypothetical protein HPP92_009885 [Vanilla planifolia]